MQSNQAHQRDDLSDYGDNQSECSEDTRSEMGHNPFKIEKELKSGEGGLFSKIMSMDIKDEKQEKKEQKRKKGNSKNKWDLRKEYNFFAK